MPRTASRRQPFRTTQSLAVAGAVPSSDESADDELTLGAGAAPVRPPTSGDRLYAFGERIGRAGVVHL